MKQTRRKELRTNELSIYLQQLYQTLERNSTYILAGVLAVPEYVQRPHER